MLLTICEMETKYVTAYHALSDQARVYEDLLHFLISFLLT